MIIPLDLVLFLILIVTAVLALYVRDLLAAVALLSGYSLFAALLFAGVSAVDVALVEAALGAGLTGVLFIAAILATTRKSKAETDRRRKLVVLPLIVGFVGLMMYASTGLPDRGDPTAPAHVGVSVSYLEGSLAQTETPNVVTSLLADYRSQDTLGETLVILTAALAASLVLARRFDRPDEISEGVPTDAGPVAESRPGTAGPDPSPTSARPYGSTVNLVQGPSRGEVRPSEDSTTTDGTSTEATTSGGATNEAAPNEPATGDGAVDPDREDDR